MKVVYSFKKGLAKFSRRSPELLRRAQERAALQFLTWANDGSPREKRRPPIRWGTLRASGSAFVDSKLVGVTPGSGGTPARAYNGKKGVVTWVWNTEYATKMHEHQGNWGKHTMNDPQAGNKWVELHLKADREALTKMIAKEFKRELDKL